MIRFLQLTVAIALLASCTWVKVTDEGALVMVKELSDTTSCKRLGKTTSIGRAELAGVDRNERKVLIELETLARNEAAKMGGNAIAPLGDIDGNEREFGVFTCP